MRLISAQIHNFLSFEDFTWPNLDPHLNIIVGANGAGKSNLIAAIKAVADVVNSRRTDTTERWRRFAHNGNTDAATKIVLEVAFDDIEEQRLLATFFAAALCREEDVRNALQQPGPAKALNAAALATFSSALMQQTDATSMAALCHGRLVVQFAGMNWYSHFESIQEPPEFTIGLTTQLSSSYLIGRRSSSNVPSSLFAAWIDSLTPTAKDNVDAYERGGELEDLSAKVRKYLSEPVEAEPPIVPDLADLPRFAPMRLGVRLEVNSPMMGSYATQRAFQVEAQRFGLEGDTTDARAIFGRLLDHGLVLTENLRRQPKYRYSAKEFKTEYVDLSSGEHLALYLAHLKNSGSVEEARQYEAIQSTFTRLTGRTFSVGIDHLPEPTQAEDSLQLFVTTTSGWHISPLEFSGAGIAEALFLSALLTTRRQKVVLLDEPASNLHLNVQTNLVKALQNVAGNQFLVVTHSPALVPADGLSQVSRLHVESGHTARASLRPGDYIEYDEMLKITKELRRSLDMRNLLFCRAVILVEGETESAAFPAWFEQVGIPLVAHDVAVFSVDGDTRFTTYLRFLRDFRIPWVIICDGPVIDRPNINGRVDIAFQLAKAGVPNVPVLHGIGFTERKVALADLGVFTLAEKATDEIERIAIFQEREEEATREAGGSKARRAHYIAATYPPPMEFAPFAQEVWEHLENISNLA